MTTRYITLPRHPRTYAALFTVAAISYLCANFLLFAVGGLVLAGGLVFVWVVGRTWVSFADDHAIVRPFGLFGGWERVAYEDIIEVRTRSRREDALILDVVTIRGTLRLGPWQAFFFDDLEHDVTALADEVRARRVLRVEHMGREPMPSVT